MSKTKKKAPASVVWFNIPVDDLKRAQKFYSSLFGWKISAIRDTSKTALVADFSAARPFSWHEHQLLDDQAGINNAKNMIGFVDGHVAYIPIYFDEDSGLPACYYDPPGGYDYKWSAN